jgi:hypothetical protein
VLLVLLLDGTSKTKLDNNGYILLLQEKSTQTFVVSKDPYQLTLHPTGNSSLLLKWGEVLWRDLSQPRLERCLSSVSERLAN